MKNKIVVYYDGACPRCIRDRQRYERLAGHRAAQMEWFDITGHESELRALGIDPRKALTELHVRDEYQRIHSELDAYILLMRKVPVLSPLAWLIDLPIVRPVLAKVYHWQVDRRLQRSGRL